MSAQLPSVLIDLLEEAATGELADFIEHRRAELETVVLAELQRKTTDRLCVVAAKLFDRPSMALAAVLPLLGAAERSAMLASRGEALARLAALQGQASRWYHIGGRPPGAAFSSAKMGTGEGRALLGKGFYFTDSLTVARTFARHAPGEAFLTTAEIKPAKMQRVEGPQGPFREAVVRSAKQVRVLSTEPVTDKGWTLGEITEQLGEARAPSLRERLLEQQSKLRSCPSAGYLEEEHAGINQRRSFCARRSAGPRRVEVDQGDLAVVDCFAGGGLLNLAAGIEGATTLDLCEVNASACATLRGAGHLWVQPTNADAWQPVRDTVGAPDLHMGGLDGRPSAEGGHAGGQQPDHHGRQDCRVVRSLGRAGQRSGLRGGLLANRRPRLWQPDQPRPGLGRRLAQGGAVGGGAAAGSTTDPLPPREGRQDRAAALDSHG
ncbi:MAG: hypothetical protein ACI9VR_001161 [Cognaticolwellia sp.]|jgi:hypothetical protein